MKKILINTLLVLLALLFLSLSASAYDMDDIESFESDIKDQLHSIVDDSVMDTLEDMGIGNFDFSEVYNISFGNITKFFSVTLKDKIKSSLNIFFELMCIVMLTGTVSTLFGNNSDSGFIGLLGTVIIILLSVSRISDTLSAVVSVLQLSGKFMLSFVPIYTLIISLSGNPASALTYNTFVISFAELMSAFITSGFTDLLGVFFCLGISFSMNSSINIGRFISAVNRAVSTLLGLSASVFSGFLSIKNILSASVDSVSVKGIRYLIGSLIPVVGSSISEAYSSLLGSINLIKSSVAVIGVLVVVIINTPIIFETLTFYISFSLLSFIADSLNATRTGDVLRTLSCGVKILLLVCVFEMFILIISTGILLSVRNGR